MMIMLMSVNGFSDFIIVLLVTKFLSYFLRLSLWSYVIMVEGGGYSEKAHARISPSCLVGGPFKGASAGGVRWVRVVIAVE